MSALTEAFSPTGSASTLRQYGLMVQWQLRSMASFLPMLVVIQVSMAVATVFGYGLLIGDAPREALMYLATGATTINLIMLGLVVVPQAVGQSKTEGSFAWMRTLPMPRWVFLAADLTMYSMVVLPGAVLALFAGAWHFDITLSVSPWLILAAPVVAGMASAIGYSIALLLKPQVAHLLSQLLVFIMLLFSPISFPASRFPAAVEAIHQWLPLQPIAEMMRSVLLANYFTMPARSIVVLAFWTVASLTGAMLVLRKRS